MEEIGAEGFQFGPPLTTSIHLDGVLLVGKEEALSPCVVVTGTAGQASQCLLPRRGSGMSIKSVCLQTVGQCGKKEDPSNHSFLL
jgi:hypothetical protein